MKNIGRSAGRNIILKNNLICGKKEAGGKN